MSEQIIESFSVPFRYPVAFTRNALDPSSRLLAGLLGELPAGKRHRVAVYVDSGVLRHHAGLVDAIRTYFQAHSDRMVLEGEPEVVPGGEAVKEDVELVLGIARSLIAKRLCRHSFVLVLGGGAVLDAVGFAVSIVHRGLRLIRMPTTVLAQNDAGVGVKNGLNLGGKNTIGTFAPPFAVVNDVTFLETLSRTHWIGGVAEAFKVALIVDASFFEWLCRRASRLRERDLQVMEQLIIRCARLHLQHIVRSGDPFEFGSARPLDFGHWLAHKLELMTRYRVSHGEAVASGMAVDSFYATAQGWLEEEESDRLLRALLEVGFELWYPELELRGTDGRRLVLDGLEEFREHLGGELSVTFPDGLGRKREEHRVDLEAVERALQQLKLRAQPARL